MRQRKIVVLAAISAVSLLPMLALAQDQDSPEKSSAKQASSDAGAKSSEREASDVPSIDPFEISDRIELSDEQQEQLAAVKERYQPRIDRAREQYRQRIDRLDEEDIKEWREELRGELEGLDWDSEEQLEQEIEKQLQQKREAYRNFARRPLVIALVQARNAADHLLTSEQRRELNRMQREEVQKYLADCEEYENVFTLPDNVELSEAEQEKWNALKQRMAPHFANAEKRYQGILAQLDEQKVQEWREELRDELADLDGLSQEELDQTIEEQVQSKLERMKGFARKKLVEQLMGARIATRQMLKDFKRRQDKKEKVAAKPKKQAGEKKESAAKKSEQSEKSEDKPDASDNK